ncbi:MAG TPA: tetratricopeptide repeat protein [Candidatus Limnocylindria bacterium]|jgi:predicted negative regulator of RcsB-dependent stress response|nr:tetratricopeptide repeat protein [Candidatus Limnocylindria bacterium]
MSSETQSVPESTLSIDLMSWFEENKQKLLIGVVVAVVVAAGMIVYRNHVTSTEENASKALVLLLSEQPNGILPNSDQLLKIAQQTAGTKASERASFLAGVKLFEDGKYAEAQTQFETLVREHPQSPVAPPASLGAASALDAQNKLEEAKSAYARLATGTVDDPLVAPSRLAQGQILEGQQKLKEALAIYDDVMKLNSSFAREAFARRTYLLQQHPELAPAPQVLTNSIKVNPPAATGLPASSPKPATLLENK